MNAGRLFAALALLFTALCAFGQSYPKGPVRVIVPFPAGGGVDTAARILAQKLAEGFGKPFVIENRGGANGNIGTEAAAKSTNDGATLLFTGAGFVTNPSLYKSVPYDPARDFEPISLMRPDRSRTSSLLPSRSPGESGLPAQARAARRISRASSST